jgi:hypothetical protein
MVTVEQSKYFVHSYFEDAARCKCTRCWEEFTQLVDETYSFCPKCGVPTAPEKRNKRWRLPYPSTELTRDKNDEIIHTECPCLFIEVQGVKNFGLDLINFVAAKTSFSLGPWRLYSWSKLGTGSVTSDGTSIGVHLYKKYDELKLTHQNKRLRYVNGEYGRIIKEEHLCMK